MIISHKLKCIYIKLLKVAGTSFEIALSKYCGADDIIVPLEEEEDMRKSLGFYGAQNYQCLGEQGAKAHVTAQTIKRLVSADIWDNYLKIATIRCPYDIIISLYYFRKFKKKIPDTCQFDEYVASLRNCKYDRLIPCFWRIQIGNKLVTDFLIRYEHLDRDIKELETKINCVGLLDTFRSINTKREIRPKDKTTASEMYSKHPNAKLMLDEIFYKEQENYEFLRKYWPMYKASLEKSMKMRI